MHPSPPLRRSLLFVPGSEPRKIDKAASVGADTLLIDLEDGVLPDDKESARAAVAAAVRRGCGAAEVCVRLNAPTTAAFAADVESMVAAGVRSFMLPKCERPEAVHAAIQRIAAACGGEDLAVLGLIETALGLSNAAAIGGVDGVEALCFGHADFALDLGVADADPSGGILYHARCTLLLAAKAAATAAIDTVCLAVRDAEAFRRDARQAQALGFDGKLCIHPAQVDIANDVFAPSPEEMARARRILEAAAAARIAGRGVFAVDGQMIDAPVIERCERLLARARRAGLPRSGGVPDS